MTADKLFSCNVSVMMCSFKEDPVAERQQQSMAPKFNENDKQKLIKDHREPEQSKNKSNGKSQQGKPGKRWNVTG